MTRAAIMDAMPPGDMERMALTMRSMTALRILMVLMMGSACGPREESTTAKKTENEMMPRMLKSAAALTAAEGWWQHISERFERKTKPMLGGAMLLTTSSKLTKKHQS